MWYYTWAYGSLKEGSESLQQNQKILNCFFYFMHSSSFLRQNLEPKIPADRDSDAFCQQEPAPEVWYARLAFFIFKLVVLRCSGRCLKGMLLPKNDNL